MKINHAKKTLAIGALAIGLIAGGTVVADAAAPQQRPPQMPSWVDPTTGVVDASKMPSRVQVVGPDGKTVRDANGKPITSKINTAPPPPPAASLQTQNNTTQETAPDGIEVITDAPIKRPY